MHLSMWKLVSKAETSPKKWSRDHDPRQKPDTKHWICCSELLLPSETPNSLLVFPRTVCNGLERLRNGFRRVSSHETTKTSVEVVYAYSEVPMRQLCWEIPKSRFWKKTCTCCKSLDRFWTLRPRRGCRSVLRCTEELFHVAYK